MASQPRSSTRVHPTSPPSAPPARRAGEGLELTTLFLSAVASAVAAYVTSKIWVAGTLWAAAMSPVIVALVKEALRRPTDMVASAVPARTARRAPLPDDLPERLGAGAPAPFPPPAAGAPEGPVRIYSTRGRRLRWRLAIVTGLLGFVVCVVAYTVPDVIAGHSVVQRGRATTLWGGSSGVRHHRATETRTVTMRTTTPKAATTTATPPVRTVTVPSQTVTVPPTATATTPAPAAAPAPAATTPQPSVAPAATTPQAAPGG